MKRLLFLFLLLPFTSIAMADKSPSPKVLSISLSKYNQVFMGRDTLAVSDLAKEIKNRLWKSYLGTGKMYDAIAFNAETGSTDESKDAVIKAIKEGLQMALKDICLEKHKQYFENLSVQKQEKTRKQFPVLFQDDFGQAR